MKLTTEQSNRILVALYMKRINKAEFARDNKFVYNTFWRWLKGKTSAEKHNVYIKYIKALSKIGIEV